MNRVGILIDYKSGLRKHVYYDIKDVGDLCEQFKKHHNMKLIEEASIVFMRHFVDNICKFDKFIKKNLNK